MQLVSIIVLVDLEVLVSEHFRESAVITQRVVSLLELLNIVNINFRLVFLKRNALLLQLIHLLLDLLLLVLLVGERVRDLRKLLVRFEVHEVTMHVSLQGGGTNQMSRVEFLQV